MNVLSIIRNDATGEAVSLHIKGTIIPNYRVNEPLAFHEATIGELTDGEATLSFPHSEDRDTHTFTFTLDTNPNDGDTAGKVAYDALAALLTHTTHAHGDPAPVIDDPLMARIATIEARLNAQVKVFDTAQLKVFRDENNKVIGHEFILSMTDASETLIAINTNFQSIEKQGADEPPHLVLRYYDDEYKIAGEVRAIIATNDFAGYRFILNGGGIGTTYTGATAYNELLVAESVNNDNN